VFLVALIKFQFEMNIDLPSALVVILDMHPRSWSQTSAAAGPDIQDVAENLLTFLRAFLLLHAENTVSVVAAHPQSSKMLYSPEIRAQSYLGAGKQLTSLEMDTIDFDLHKAIVEFSTELSEHPAEAFQGMPSMLSSALAIAACYCNRITGNRPGSHITNRKSIPRILTITPSDDFSGQYVPLMNCFFSFEKSGILVDALVLAETVIAAIHHSAHQHPI
jgi:hypothetical protein